MPETIDQQSTEIVDPNQLSPEVQAALVEAAKQQSEAEQSTIPFISLKGKKFTVGEDKLGTQLKVVILADVFDHSWYDRPYDPSSDEVFPPACFAIGDDVNSMEPHVDSPMPQSDVCDGCPKNEFGSATQGKGKACRNGRRILIASVAEDNYVNFGDLAIINMSPTALRGFSKYVKSIATIKRLPLWSVVTILGFDEDSAYPVLTAGYHDIVRGADIEVIAKRLPDFKKEVSRPYDTSNYEAPGDVAAKETKKSKMS